MKFILDQAFLGENPINPLNISNINSPADSLNSLDINPVFNEMAEQEEQPHLTLKMIEMLMPSYDGISDVRDFVRRLQQLYDQCPQEQRQYFLMLSKLKLKLKGAARDLIEGVEVNVFQNYVDRLINLFSPDNENVTSQADFTSCKQLKNESVQEFAARVQTAKRRLCDRLTAKRAEMGGQILESQVLNVFLAGLKSSLRQFMKFRPVTVATKRCRDFFSLNNESNFQ